MIEHSLRFDFPTSNNQAEYEACIAGIRMAREIGAKAITICSNSQLVVSQIRGDYSAKEPMLQKYLSKVRELLLDFVKFEIKHIPPEENSRADLLSKLASTKKTSNYRSVIEQTIPQPVIIMQIVAGDWRFLILKYIIKGTLPEDPKEAKKIEKQASNFVEVEGNLYRRGTSVPLLKCLSPEESKYVLAEVHEGSCGHHIGGKSLAWKALRAGYF